MGGKSAIVPFPRSRLARFPVGELGSDHHKDVVLLEVDITRARQRLRNESGSERIQLQSWLATQVAVSIRNHPEVHASQQRNSGATDAVHVRIAIERTFADRRLPIQLLLAHADSRDASDLVEQIEAAMDQAPTCEEIVFGGTGARGALRTVFRRLPSRAQQACALRVLESGRPLRAAQPLPGRTVSLFSVGSGARVRGWFIPRAADPVAIGVGAVSQKAAVINGRIEPREIVHLSVLLDSKSGQSDAASRWLSSLIKGMEGAFRPIPVS